MKNDFIDNLTRGIDYTRTCDFLARNIVDKKYEIYKKNSDIQALKAYLDRVINCDDVVVSYNEMDSCRIDIKASVELPPDILRSVSREEVMSFLINSIFKDSFDNWTIKNVIFNDPATIVFWEDGTKTVVKAQDEPFDKEKGLAMAIVKKMYGNKGSYFNRIKKWTKDEEADQSSPKNVRIFDEIDVFSDKFNVLSDAIRASLGRMGVTNDKTEEPSDRNNDKTDKSDINHKKEQTKAPYVTIDGSNLYSD